MWKIIYDGENKFEHVEFVPDKLKDNYIRIKPEFVAICGSDKNIVFKGKRKGLEPIALGHEIYGKVLEGNGKDMNGIELQSGDKVVVFPNYYCDVCPDCIVSHTNTCRNKVSIGVNAEGGLSEVFDVPSKFLLKISDNVDSRIATLTEPLAVMVRALNKFNNNGRLIIVGGGVTGTLGYILAKIKGFQDVVIVEAFSEKVLHLRSKRFPAMLTSEFLNNEINTFSGPFNILDTVGSNASAEFWINLARSTVSGSKVVLTGLDGSEFTVPQDVLIRKELNIEGSIIYTKEDFIETGKIIEQHSDKFKTIIDYEGSSKDVETWLIPTMQRKDILKIIVKM